MEETVLRCRSRLVWCSGPDDWMQASPDCHWQQRIDVQEIRPGQVEPIFYLLLSWSKAHQRWWWRSNSQRSHSSCHAASSLLPFHVCVIETKLSAASFKPGFWIQFSNKCSQHLTFLTACDSTALKSAWHFCRGSWAAAWQILHSDHFMALTADMAWVF